MTRSATARKTDALVANGVALVLGTAAFSVSFTHVVKVAAEHGQGGWVSKAIATSVELMALASVAELRRRKSRGESVWIAVAVLLLGVAMSLASNLATAAPGAWGKLMAAWPAVAFLAVASLVESRTGGRDEDGSGSARADAEARTGQAVEIRTEPARPSAPAPYGVRTESVRTDAAPRTEAHTQDARTEPVRVDEARTEPVRTEPVRTLEIRTDEARTDEAPDAGTDEAPVPADAVDQADAAPAPIAEKQDVDEELQDAAPVQDAPVLPAAPAPAAPAVAMLTGSDSRDKASDSVLVAPSDTLAAATVPASAAEVAPASGWLPGASGLLLPAGLAAVAEKPALIVPGRPAPVPGPRQAPASARTDQTRPPRTAARTERVAKPRTDAAPRTDQARTDALRTDRPTRTDVVAELVSSIRTDAGWRPDYEALEARTGYKRSFLEKCVGDARKTVAAA